MCNAAEAGIGESITKLMREVNRLDGVIVEQAHEIDKLGLELKLKKEQIAHLIDRTNEMIDKMIAANLMEG